MKIMQSMRKTVPISSLLSVKPPMWRLPKPVSSTGSSAFLREKPFCPCDGTCPQCAGSDLKSDLLRGDYLLEAVHDGQGMVSRYSHSRGEPVRKIQAGLKQLEPAALPVYGVDGIFGPETEGAVRHFQRVTHLGYHQVDGKVGPVTLGALDDRLAAKKVRPLCPVGTNFFGSSIDCLDPTRKTDCACDCQSYCKTVARHYAVKKIIAGITWFGNPDPKDLKTMDWKCRFFQNPQEDCTWTCLVKFDYRSKTFSVGVVYLAGQKLFYAATSHPVIHAPPCIYTYTCGQPLKLYEKACYK